MNEELKKYIKGLLEQNKDPQEVRKALIAVGWKEADINAAMTDFLSSTASVPIPPLPPKQGPHSMVEIFMNLLSFVLLGIVSTALGVLYFQIINKYFPDLLQQTSYGFGAFSTSAIHYSIAALIVGFPIYAWTIWFWFKSFRNTPEKIESRLSKWLTYIILFLAAGTIIGDLITVIYNFLQGEVSARFLLKALTIIVIAGFIFGFYFLERKKIQYKKYVSRGVFQVVGGLCALFIIIGIVFGFLAGGTRGEERLRRFDLQRVSDLEQISSGVSAFATDNMRLPQSLNELKTNARYNYYVSRLNDPETQKEYEYRVMSQVDYELCAEFALSTKDSMAQPYAYPYGVFGAHDAGRVCWQNTVTVDGRNIPVKPLPMQ